MNDKFVFYNITNIIDISGKEVDENGKKIEKE